MADVSLAALFDIKRFAVLTAWLNPQTSSLIRPAMAWAWYARVCPIFDYPEPADDPYAGAWSISRDFVDRVATYCDEKHDADQTVAFTELEQRFGGRGYRLGLAAVLRYAFLNGCYDPDFYAELLLRSPIEAKFINHQLSPTEITLK